MNPKAIFVLFTLAQTTAFRVTIVLLTAGAVAFFLRRRSASMRHIVWTVALTAAALLPVVGNQLPSMRIALPPATLKQIDEWAYQQGGLDLRFTRMTFPGSKAVEFTPAESAELAKAMAPLLPVRMSTDPKPKRRDLSDMLVFLWSLGVATVAWRTLAGVLAIRRMAARCRPATDAGLLFTVQGMVKEAGVRRPIRLLLSGDGMDGVPPMTWGTRRPTILLPAAAPEWPADQLRAVLLHELAHIRRNDYLWQMLARIPCALYWCHPMAWWAGDRMRDESEHACDDRVLTAGASAPDYAGLLLDAARSVRGSCAASPATVALGLVRRSRIETRLRAVLSLGVPRRPATRRAVATACIVASAILVPLGTLRAVLMPGLSDAGVPYDYVDADGGRIELPGNITVELLGVTDGGYGPRSWWSADGRLIRAPYANFEERSMFKLPTPPRQFAIRLTVPAGGEPNIDTSLPDNTFATKRTERVSELGVLEGPREQVETAPDGRVVYTKSVWAGYSSRKRSADVYIRVPAGPWHAVAHCGAKLGTVRAEDGSAVEFRRGLDTTGWTKPSRVPNLAQWNLPTPSFLVKDHVGDVDRRIVVLDAQGHEVSTMIDYSIRAGFSAQNSVMFPRAIAGFRLGGLRLETRPWWWVRFAGLRLSPQSGASAPIPIAPPRLLRYMFVRAEPLRKSTQALGPQLMFHAPNRVGLRHESAYLLDLARTYPDYRFEKGPSGDVALPEQGEATIHVDASPSDPARFHLDLKAAVPTPDEAENGGRGAEWDGTPECRRAMAEGRVDGLAIVRLNGRFGWDDSIMHAGYMIVTRKTGSSVVAAWDKGDSDDRRGRPCRMLVVSVDE